MKTFSAKPDAVQRGWYVVDASGRVLGRLATEIARRLRGKHKPEFTPHVDTGDYIVVVNADKLRVTGRKAQNKIYHRHSGYPGGVFSESFSKLHGRQPERVLKLSDAEFLRPIYLIYSRGRKLSPSARNFMGIFDAFKKTVHGGAK